MEEDDDLFYKLFDEREENSTVQQETNHEMEDVEEAQAIELTGPDERDGISVAKREIIFTMVEHANPPKATHQPNRSPVKSISSNFADIQRLHKLKGVERTPTTLNFETSNPSLLSNKEGRPQREKQFLKRYAIDDERNIKLRHKIVY